MIVKQIVLISTLELIRKCIRNSKEIEDIDVGM